MFCCKELIKIFISVIISITIEYRMLEIYLNQNFTFEYKFRVQLVTS